MAGNDKLLKTIFSAINELNQMLPKEKQIEKSVNAVLFGKKGKLDSLGLVSLIVSLEQKIEEEYGATITIAGEASMSLNNSPFETIETLTAYITSLLEKKTSE